MNNAIEIRELVKEYPSFRLNIPSLDIPKGKIVGLIGENGAGKTTLISLLLNQISRVTGDVRILGLDNILKETIAKSKLGFVVDECCFHPCLTPKNINTILKSVYTAWDEAYFGELIKRFGIPYVKKISDFSKGMKNKLMMATSLAHNPELLILDEITSGLDPVMRDDILQIMQEFTSGSSKSVLFSTHITSDLEKIADYVAFLHQGELVFVEEMETLKNNFCVAKCSKNEFDAVRNNQVKAFKIESDGNITVLWRKDAAHNDFFTAIDYTTPSLEEIMLLHIKGDVG